MVTELDHAMTSRFAVSATAESHFSWLRTRLSIERTLMSWVRTAVSLIGFGFTIEQFFVRLQRMPGAVAARFTDAPHWMGLSLIFCGVASLLISVWQYHWSIRYLRSADFSPIAGVTDGVVLTPLYAVCFALILVGLFAFFAVLLRLT